MGTYYQIIAYLQNKEFQFKSLTYDTSFSGYFEIKFAKVSEVSPAGERWFKLSRDPRDFIVDLYEIIDGKEVDLGRQNFDGEDWDGGILEAGKKLIDGIKL